MQYDTGDHVAVVPENSPQTVAAAAAALGQAPDQVFRLALPPGNPQQLRSPFPGERAPHLPKDVPCSDTGLVDQFFEQLCALVVAPPAVYARCISVIGSQH